MSSSIRTSPSSTLYWSWAKYSLITLWPRRTVPDVGSFHAGQQFDERRLAGAVHTDQRHAIAALDRESSIAKDELLAVALRECFGFDDHAAGGRRLREFEVNHRLFIRNLDALDFFQLFNPRLHLLGLARLVAEAVDESLKVLDLVALVAPGSHELGTALVFLREVFCVVALVDGEALVPYLHGAVDGDVEKVAVVGDQDVAEGVSLEVVLEPVACFEIQVIRGLVQKQEIGLGQQQLGQRDAHLPAARELIGLPQPVFLGETEAGEHGPHLGVERIAIKGVEALLQAAKNVRRRIHTPGWRGRVR